MAVSHFSHSVNLTKLLWEWGYHGEQAPNHVILSPPWPCKASSPKLRWGWGGCWPEEGVVEVEVRRQEGSCTQPCLLAKRWRGEGRDILAEGQSQSGAQSLLWEWGLHSSRGQGHPPCPLSSKGHSYCSRSTAYPPGELCVPNIILQKQKGTHDICRHFRHLLAVTENSLHQFAALLTADPPPKYWKTREAAED